MSDMTATTTYKNLLVLSFGFFFIHAAFMPIQNIQSSIHKEPSLGFASLTALYATSIISCSFLPNVLMAKFKLKVIMVISMCSFPLYALANFLPTWGTILPASILLGICAAVMWTCHSSYITKIATTYATTVKLPKDPLVSKFFSIFYVVFQCSQIVGNGVSSAVLRNVNSDIQKGNISNKPNISCGAKYCPSASSFTDIETIHPDIIIKLMSIFLGFALAGVLVVIIFLDKLPEEAKDDTPLLTLCFSTIIQLKNPMFLLLIPISIFSGMEQAFVYGEYTKAFVSCTIGIDAVGYSMMCFGSMACLISMTIGLIVRWTGTYALMILGMFSYLGLMTWFLVLDTHAYPPLIFYVGALCCGFTSAIWMSQSNAIYGIYFPKTQDAAFSIFRMIQGLGFTISFGYGNILCVSTKIYILMSLLVVSIIFYSIAEFLYRKNQSNDRKKVVNEAEDCIENINMDEKF